MQNCVPSVKDQEVERCGVAALNAVVLLRRFGVVALTIVVVTLLAVQMELKSWTLAQSFVNVKVCCLVMLTFNVIVLP